MLIDEIKALKKDGEIILNVDDSDDWIIIDMIAGTYTPFMLNLMLNWIGITICTACWLIAAFGIIVADEEKRQAQHLSVSFSGLAGSVCF